MRFRHAIALLGLVLVLGSGLRSAEPSSPRWPQFRGPGSLSISTAANLPITWSADRNVAWKTSIPGLGWSSPIVWDDKIFLTTVVSEKETETPKKGLYFGGERLTVPTDTHRWLVLCLDLASGKILWQQEAVKGMPTSRRHVKNTYASETPVTDGKRVYACFGNVGLFSFDFNGKLIWSQKLPSYPTRYGWGTAASPVLHRDRLYLVNDNDAKSSLAAYDAETGRELWRVDRDEKSNWATPYIWENEKRTEIITPGTRRIRSYDLDGKLLWELGGMSSIVIPTPFARDNLLYVCSGYVGDKTRPVYAIRPGASGDISLKDGQTANEFIAWHDPTAGPYNPSPLLYGDYFYVLYDFGFLSCREAKTGREIYGKQRLNTTGTSAFTTSPWAYDNKIFCLSEDGDTFVVQAGPEYKLLAKNSLGEMSMACPAIGGNRLLIRTSASLFCIQNQVGK